MPRKPPGATRVHKKFEILLRELKSELLTFYDRRLVSAIVFGSVGRGTPRMDSDLDLLIVANPLPRGRMARVGEFQTIEKALRRRLDLLEKEGVHTTLAPLFKTPEEVRRGSLLFLDMIDDSRILYDCSGFWKKYIAGFQKRLRRLGARKIIQGDRWYWDLKPDYKAGEIFEI